MLTQLSIADALFGKTKKAVICTLYATPHRAWHLRELARHAAVSATMLSKEVNLLVMAGIVRDEKNGNRRMLRANPDCPVFDELCGLARKTGGIADEVRAALDGLAGVDVAFLFGSVAKGQENAASDVDVCVIGQVPNSTVDRAMSDIEPLLGRPIHALVYTSDEFREKLARQNPFVRKLLGTEKIYLKGDAHELERTLGQLGGHSPTASPRARLG